LVGVFPSLLSRFKQFTLFLKQTICQTISSLN
jgi:hypothetical protein